MVYASIDNYTKDLYLEITWLFGNCFLLSMMIEIKINNVAWLFYG